MEDGTPPVELEALRALGTPPLLFVGSGLSRRYLALETWRGLLARFAEPTARPVEYYLSAADGDYPRAGTILADAFHEIWWTKPQFEESRKQYGELASKGRSLPLKIEIAKHIREARLTSDPRLLQEIDELKKACVETVITTNYDDLMEQVFPEFKAFVGQRSLLFAPLHGTAETYKVHGCATDPNSLVLTGDDYESFKRQSPYLVAKIATLLVERPVIFLGYSLTDDYVQNILSEFVACLDDEQIARFGRRIFFVQYNQETRLSATDTFYTLREGRGHLPLVRIEASDYKPIYSALAMLKRQLPARVLRMLKERVYELVASCTPVGNLVAVDIEDATSSHDIDVVFGVGVRSVQGYVGISREDLALDVIADETKFDASKIVTVTIPRIARKGLWIPIWRYLGRLVPDHDISGVTLDPIVRMLAGREDYAASIPYGKNAADRARKYASLAALFAKEDLSKALYLLFLRDVSGIDPNELRDELRKCSAKALSRDNYKSLWMRAVCLYDRLKFGPKL